jgi:hypothetical protein
MREMDFETQTAMIDKLIKAENQNLISHFQAVAKYNGVSMDRAEIMSENIAKINEEYKVESESENMEESEQTKKQGNDNGAKSE